MTFRKPRSSLSHLDTVGTQPMPSTEKDDHWFIDAVEREYRNKRRWVNRDKCNHCYNWLGQCVSCGALRPRTPDEDGK